MIRCFVSNFDPARTRDADGLLGLVISDYVAYYVPTPMRQRWGVAGSYRQESVRRLALLFLPRVINNPCLHATILLRLATRSPRLLLGFWRTVLIAKHSIDVNVGLEIGPGLVLPHPVGIVMGAGLSLGRNVTIMHHVSLGGLVQRPATRFSPTICDDAVIYTHSMVLGPITIGEKAVVGAGSWLDHDLEPGEVHKAQPVRPAA